jgi:tRNA 2-thiocytidine biosynthesis protein TtcA
MAYASPLEARIAKKTTRAILDYGMIEDGDRVMIGLSGGKDSWALLQMLDVLRQRAPIDFSIMAVNVDSGYEAYRHDLIRSTCEARGWELHVEHTSIGEVLDDLLDADATPCSLCARLRRGVLYRIASEIGATKIALGHHADDFIETLLINVFFAGAIKAMPARLVSDDRRHVVIRPFVYVSEEEARLYTRASGLPVVGCCCPVCGDLGLQRQRMKRLLAELEREHPGVKASLLKSLANVHPRHLLDRRLNLGPGAVEHVEPAHGGSQGQKGAATGSTRVSREVNPPMSRPTVTGPGPVAGLSDEEANRQAGERRAGVPRFIPLTITPTAAGCGSDGRSDATPSE